MHIVHKVFCVKLQQSTVMSVLAASKFGIQFNFFSRALVSALFRTILMACFLYGTPTWAVDGDDVTVLSGPAVTVDNNAGSANSLCYYSTAGSAVVCGDGSTQATASNTVAIGTNVKANAKKSIVIGNNINTATTSGEDSVAIGNDGVKATGKYATAIGGGGSFRDIEATGEASTAIGSDSHAIGDGSFALGRDSNAIGDRSMSVGVNSKALSADTIVLGNDAQTDADSVDAISVGNGSNAFGSRSVAIGSTARVGNGSNNKVTSSVAIGDQARTNSKQSIVIGFQSEISTNNSENAIAIGRQAKAKSNNAIALGRGATVNAAGGNDAVVIGSGAKAIGTNNNGAVIIGSGANSNQNSDRAIAIGAGAKTIAAKTIVMGEFAEVTTTGAADSIAIGRRSKVSTNGGIAFGAFSVGDRGNATANTVAGFGGYNPVTNTVDGANADIVATRSTMGAFSIGDAANNRRRQITNVAAGTTDTDAVNVAQLKALAAGQVQYYSVNNGPAVAPPATNNKGNDGASGAQALAAGVNAKATGASSSAVGAQSLASGGQSSAFGDDSQALGDNTLAMGSVSRANADGSTAIGSGATVRAVSPSMDGASGVAVGVNSSATSSDVAIGGTALSTGASDASGFLTNSKGRNTAVGFGAGGNLDGANNSVLGFESGNSVAGNGNSAVGFRAGSRVAGDRNALVGHNAGGGGYGAPFAMSGNDNVGSGSGVLAAADGDNNVGIGSVAGAQVTGSNNVAIGFQAGTQATFNNATGAPTAGAPLTYSNAINIGNATKALTNHSIAIGNLAQAGNVATGNTEAIAIGNGAQATGNQSISIGTGNIVSGNNSGAIGDPNNVTGNESYALGNNNTIAANSSFAVGNNINIAAVHTGSVGLGHSTTVGAVNVGNYTYQGVNNGQVAGRRGVGTQVVSVGSAGNERQIQNVAPGVVSATSTDAINGSQLYHTIDNLNAMGSSLTAIYGDIKGLRDAIQRNAKIANAGTAASMAMASTPQPHDPGASMISAGVGNYNGESAFAVGLSTISDNGRWLLKGAVSRDSQHNTGASVGMGYQW